MSAVRKALEASRYEFVCLAPRLDGKFQANANACAALCKEAMTEHDALVAALRRVVEAGITPADEMEGESGVEAFRALDHAKEVLARVDRP